MRLAIIGFLIALTLPCVSGAQPEPPDLLRQPESWIDAAQKPSENFHQYALGGFFRMMAPPQPGQGCSPGHLANQWLDQSVRHLVSPRGQLSALADGLENRPGSGLGEALQQIDKIDRPEAVMAGLACLNRSRRLLKSPL